MTRYLITMTDVEGSWDALSPSEQDRILGQHKEFRAVLEREDRFVAAYHLHPRAEAQTVRRERDGSETTRSGPFSDAPEYPGGYYVIEAESIEDAVEWARRGRFMVGANEVREIF